MIWFDEKIHLTYTHYLWRYFQLSVQVIILDRQKQRIFQNKMVKIIPSLSLRSISTYTQYCPRKQKQFFFTRKACKLQATVFCRSPLPPEQVCTRREPKLGTPQWDSIWCCKKNKFEFLPLKLLKVTLRQIKNWHFVYFIFVGTACMAVCDFAL